MDMDMQHGHGHAAWTWTQAQIWSCGMDLDSGHAWMHGCQNADKKLSPASLVFHSFTTLSPALAFRHHGQSGTAGHRLIR
jgi:hypothetical protein